MSSPQTRFDHVYDTHVLLHSDTFPPPPPPPRDAPFTSPLRRDNVFPPSLTTSAAGHIGSLHSTPLSAISHQSLFTPIYSSPMATSNTAITRGVSPMAPRQASQYGVQYDPRDWTSRDVRANQVRRVREQQAEDGLSSPPPPYSPHTASQAPNSSITSSPADSSPSTSRSVAQQVSITTHSPPQENINSRPRSVYNGTAANNRHSIHLSYPVPPPPPPASNFRQSTYPINTTNHSFVPVTGILDPGTYPPTSRRAVSASAEMSRQPEPGPSRRSNSRQPTWQPGMPLPGPPPGPPPSTSRSQSVSAGERSTSGSTSRTRPVRFSVHTSQLGPIPATPINWTDESEILTGHEVLHIDTDVSQASRLQKQPESEVLSSGKSTCTPNTGSSVLSRSSAVRDSSIQGLRERRAQQRVSRSITAAELNDLSVQTNPWASAMGQTQNSNISSPAEPSSGGLPSRARRPYASNVGLLVDNVMTESPLDTATPPISPPIRSSNNIHTPRSTGVTPKALPTPPPSQTTPLSARSMKAMSRGSISGTPSDDIDEFLLKAANRHAEFVQKEKAASSDTARLQLFAEYILLEASVRQLRYNSAIHSPGFDVQAVRDKLFEPISAPNSVSTTKERHLEPQRSTVDMRPQPRHESSWKEYEPALSPIASMDHDEMSSRGRAPSRWWESQSGSQSGGGKRPQIIRSKRESKYMGLSKELLMAHSPDTEPSTYPGLDNFSHDSVYPAEKGDSETFGYYEETPRPLSQIYKPESPKFLDISRFITLPPPYPRHHPAVNNNHPNLAQYRTTVRTLSDLAEVHSRRQRHKANNEALQHEHKRKLSDSWRTFRNAVQKQIDEGSISYAEAAEAEQAYKANEIQLNKSCLQAEFDTLQDAVINPLHDLLQERISKLNSSLDQLQTDLCTDARRLDPDGPQEEGDETPELLEKLTQLKWLFDTREQIQRECFEILSERNDKFRAIVLLSYQSQNNVEKIRETEAFFDEDTRTRRSQYCTESFNRHEEFMKVIDEHVRRGVELQSSAFWDIAPGLLDVLQKIPDNLRNLPGLQIPAKEYKENPSYRQYPQQYLYSLLSHAEKSTYQYIEGQINLQCLLHEVKTSLSAARYRCLQARENGTRDEEVAAANKEEEATLTAELKQKAGMIEEQWLEALGSQLQGTRERVKTLLQQDNAWEEIAQEDA